MNPRVLPDTSAVRGHLDDRISLHMLHPRQADDPMRLCGRIMTQLDHYFSMRHLTYLSGQRDLFFQAVTAILQAQPGTVTAVPFQPGLGKSTLIRALLEILSEEFRGGTPIAERMGGVLVVVEKTAEADELEQLCNQAGGTPVAKAISSINDYNLSQGRCLNGRAATYAECPGRQCPDYAICPLAQAPSQTHQTPVLILLHARYQRHLEDMTPFLTWEGTDGRIHTRTLLLVDELPNLIEDNLLDLSLLNRLESVFAQLKPSYQPRYRVEKSSLLYQWNTCIRTPFFRLVKHILKQPGLYGILSPEDFTAAGFAEEALQAVRADIVRYVDTPVHDALRVVDILLAQENAYYAVGQDTALFFPRLRTLGGEGQPAAVIFSGTASLSPELADNPKIHMLSTSPLESYQRLHIHIQRGDVFSSSKSGLAREQNQVALTAWFRFLLPLLAQRHSHILAVTYQQYARQIWKAVPDFHELLIPYIAADGSPQPLLPYFGGLNGSNLYRQSTCVVCLGLNRFEPRDYISRTLALDFDGSRKTELCAGLRQNPAVQLDCCLPVMQMQDLTLARDLVQLVFRSALRNHAETQPIELWLLQPPNGVVGHLQSYFPGCAIEEHRELPDSCRLAAVTHRNYQGQKTHAAKLLSYLMAQDGGSALTPEEIRSATGLSQAQFKEAKKNREVIRYFNEHIQTYGSGINTVYYRKSNSICISPFQTVETTQKGGMSIAHGNPGRPEAGDHLADQSGSAEPGNTGDSGAHLPAISGSKLSSGHVPVRQGTAV